MGNGASAGPRHLPAGTCRTWPPARAELDSFDFIDGLVLQGGPHLEILTGISLQGGLIGAWPGPLFTAVATLATLLAHWRAVGLPTYAQFDNDTRFQGPPQHRDVVSRVMRLCLSLGVTPRVRARARATGFRTPSRISMDAGKRKSGAASTMSPWLPSVPGRSASSARRGCGGLPA